MSMRSLVLAFGVLGCAPEDPSSAQPHDPPARPPEPSMPAAAEPRVATPEPVADDAWQMTTLVAQGPASMIGKHGHYELRFTEGGTRLTLSRVGQDGTALPSDRTMMGSTALRRAFVPALEGTERDVQFTVELANDRGRQSITAHAWVLGDRMVGRWWYAPRGDAAEGEIVGVLVGKKGIAPGFVEVASVQQLPCPICCDAMTNCGGMGPGACNSSNVCLAACEPSSDGSDEGPPSGRTMSELRTGCEASW